MSAYLVDDHVINAIVTHIAQTELKFNGYTLKTTTNKQRLATALYQMNVEALHERYQERAKSYFGDCLGITYKEHTVDDLQLFKYIDCYTYQCSEGNVPSMKLFKEIEKIQEKLASKIVRTLPAYETATWG